jgi:AcrR family transcriptional regulator
MSGGTAVDAAVAAAPTGPSRPGRHRSEAADAAILDATIEVLAERGYGGLSVAEVISRAGVSSATLYRRWENKEQLVVAAVATLVPVAEDTDTGSLDGDVAVFLRNIAASIAQRHEVVHDALTVEARHNESLAASLRTRFLAPRLDQLGGILGRAKRRGELTSAPSVEVAMSLIAGPLYHRANVLNETLSPAFVKAATKHAVAALRARC